MDIQGIVLMFCVVGGFMILTGGIKRICKTYLDKDKRRIREKNWKGAE